MLNVNNLLHLEMKIQKKRNIEECPLKMSACIFKTFICSNCYSLCLRQESCVPGQFEHFLHQLIYL